MKYLHRICLAAVLTALVAVLCGCNAADYALPAQVDMQPGESVALAGLVHYTGAEEEQATAENAAAMLQTIGSVDNVSFRFASDVPGVVSVDDEGVMTAGVTGDATVIVSCTALDYYAEVHVSVRSLPQSLSMEPVAALTPGESYELNAEVRPGKKYAQLLYASNDENVATVDENGMITAVAEGETEVSAQVAGSSLTAACRVVVTQEDEMMQVVTLSRADAAMATGETLLLSAGASPEDDTAVVWQSEDASVVSVDETGMVTAVGAGVAAVTATVGDKTATCTVTVSAPATAESATPETAAAAAQATKETAATSETATSETATPETADAQDEEEACEPVMAETWADAEQTATAESATKEPTIDKPTTEKATTEKTATPEDATSETVAAVEEATPEKATGEKATPEDASPKKAEATTEATQKPGDNIAATPETATSETATSETATPETATEDEMESIDLDVFYQQTPESATAGSATHDEDDEEPQSNRSWPRLPNGMPIGPGPVIPRRTPETAEPTTPETAQPAGPAKDDAMQTPETAANPETARPEDAPTSPNGNPRNGHVGNREFQNYI